MDKRNSHIDMNHLNSINTPTIIKTSKNWVLPPRLRPGRKPRPGKKPNSTTTSTSSNSSSSATSPGSSISSNNSSVSPAPLLSKKSKKKEQEQQDSIEQALKKIKDENQYLKVELSKLVSDLKSLQQSKQSQLQESELHKKRNHLEMEELNTYKSLVLIDDSDDDNSSQISTPSLMSNSSSLSSNSSLHPTPMNGSLSSIQEDQVLKIEDFLNVSYFENTSNGNISLDTFNIDKKETVVKDEEIEFQFLKNQGVFKGEKDLFLEVGKIEDEFIEW